MTANPGPAQEFDVIVVGAGAAGSVVARRLADASRNRPRAFLTSSRSWSASGWAG